MKKSLFSTSISLHRELLTLQQLSVINPVPPDCDKLVTLIIGSSKRRSLLMAEDDDEVFLVRSFNGMVWYSSV